MGDHLRLLLLRPLLRLRRPEAQGGGVDAVAETGRLRTILGPETILGTDIGRYLSPKRRGDNQISTGHLEKGLSGLNINWTIEKVR